MMFDVALLNVGHLRKRALHKLRSYSSFRLHLFHVTEVPEDAKEPAILRGYRLNCSSWDCIRSVCVATNETMNIWTHFLAVWYFLFRFASFCPVFQSLSDPYMWSFISYTITICLYPLFSSLAHTFSSMSSTARHVFFFVDYAGICIFSFGSGLLYRSYVFPEEMLDNPFFNEWFLPICAFNAVACTTLACSSRFLQSPFLQKSARILAFFVPYVWANLPVIHRVFCGDWYLSTPYHARQFMATFLSTFFYATHIPERFAPGKFDFIGNSHNLLHVFGIMATNEQMTGAVEDLLVRHESFLERQGWAVNPCWSTYGLLGVVLGNLAVITVFSVYVVKYGTTKAEATAGRGEGARIITGEDYIARKLR